MNNKVGIIGYGVLGHKIGSLFPNACYCDPNLGLDDILECDIGFVCVPTPLKAFPLKTLSLDMFIVEEVVRLHKCKIFVICSTLQPGTADKLAEKGKKIVVQPEYIGESVEHPMADITKQKFIILGGDKEDVNEVISLYQTVYNANIRIKTVTRKEAEVIKLSENRAIAFKILQCQELYDACVEHNIDYNLIREMVYGEDPRFNLWWTFVYKNKRGCDSKCIPKDVYGWCHWAGNSSLTDDLLKYNSMLIDKQVMAL